MGQTASITSGRDAKNLAYAVKFAFTLSALDRACRPAGLAKTSTSKTIGRNS